MYCLYRTQSTLSRYLRAALFVEETTRTGVANQTATIMESRLFRFKHQCSAWRGQKTQQHRFDAEPQPRAAHLEA